MADIYEKLGNKIRLFRRAKGLSQEQLALEAKVDLTSVSEVESGLRNPSIRTLHKISSALKVKTSELIEF